MMLLVLALVIDQCFGEYPQRIHPVCWMGRLARFCRRFLYKPAQSPTKQWLSGTLCLSLCLFISYSVCHFSLLWFDKIGLSWLIGLFWLKASFALHSLTSAGQRLHDSLRRDNLETAQSDLRWLCSRSSEHFDHADFASGGISSLAENLSDSFIAPILFYLCFGVEGAIVYRMANTLDANFGYRGAYEYFGKAMAKLDDLLNWIPARLTAFFLLMSGALQGLTWRQGWQLAWREHGLTPSPNGGYPMATMAGLLQCRLEKPGSYRLGAAYQVPCPEVLRHAITLSRTTGLLFAAVVLFFLFIGNL